VPWNLLLVYVGYVFKENWNILEKYTIYIDIVAVAAIILLIIYVAKKIKWGVKSE
jgi:membrane protein DedA with SNARE-associated domain